MCFWLALGGSLRGRFGVVKSEISMGFALVLVFVFVLAFAFALVLVLVFVLRSCWCSCRVSVRVVVYCSRCRLVFALSSSVPVVV